MSKFNSKKYCSSSLMSLFPASKFKTKILEKNQSFITIFSLTGIIVAFNKENFCLCKIMVD